MYANIYILWLAILPLIIWQGWYEPPKVLIFLIGGLMVSCYWIYKVLIKRKNFVFSKADIFYFLWILVLLLSSIFGVHTFESIIGGSYRHQGVIFFLILWLVGKTYLDLPGSKKKLLYKMIALGVILEGLIVIFQVIAGHTYFGKPLGTLGEVNAVAGFLAIGSFFVYESFPGFLTIFLLIPLMLTGSRTGFLSFLANAGNLISSFIGKLNKPARKFIWPIFAVLGIIAIIVLSGGKINSFFENRPMLWNLGISAVAQKPILGFGAESGEVVFNEAFYKNGTPLSNLIIDRSHNIFIDVAMWSGTVGLILFCGWLILSYKNLKELLGKLAFFSFLIYAFLQPLSIVHWILLFLII